MHPITEELVRIPFFQWNLKNSIDRSKDVVFVLMIRVSGCIVPSKKGNCESWVFGKKEFGGFTY